MTSFTLNKELNIKIPSRNIELNGILYIPKEACGLVLFAHGSGSSRFSVRNQFVSHVLNDAKLATLLFDLLTSDEEVIDNITSKLRFDIEFLASRLVDVTEWCLQQSMLASLPIGYFGASTGGGAALVAAAMEPDKISAVVSRGGRPDLAGNFLKTVQSPTLLIVGSRDKIVIQMNEEALSQLNCTKGLELVQGATHLFEEPGTLNEAAHLAKAWFLKYLCDAHL